MWSSSAAAAADPSAPADGAPQPPELSEAGYLREVLHLTARQTEADVVDELIAKASALGIATASRPSTPGKADISSADSATTSHARNSSTDSDASASTALTSPSIHGAPALEPPSPALRRRRSKSLSFSQYDKYLAQVDPNLKQPKFRLEAPPEPAPSLFSVSTRKSYQSIKRVLKNRVTRKKRSTPAFGALNSCICCREDFPRAQALQVLPCGHPYCGDCLRIIIDQSRTDESKMPPRCCTVPIPGTTVKAVLTREEQSGFLKSVQQFSTPWEARIFCPNASCLEFIPPRDRIDPKHPFEVVCRRCRTRVCVTCKRNAHPLGHDCPGDLELDAVLKMGEKSGWRRCYKCRTLVELAQGCTHMTCRCKAQFCYICGAVWDSLIGCPNFCNGEEELERRRVEEETRLAEQEAEKLAREEAAARAEADRAEAARRTAESDEFRALRADQERELRRFRTFERKTKRIQWTRHSERKLAMVERYSDLADKMRDRHAKTVQHLEDRQIAAEMDLRGTLEQSEKSVRIRLKHMEAYCDGLGRNPTGPGGPAGDKMPQRVVTERDLRELGQQYNLRDGMERLHQARINVMRDRQAKRMEELLERHEAELRKLEDKREEDLEDLAAEFTHDEDALARIFGDRKAKMIQRWELANEIMRHEMEAKYKAAFGPMPLPDWPAEGEPGDERLSSVEE